MDTKNDRQALLTTASDVPNSKQHTYRKSTIILSILIGIVIIGIIIFVLYTVLSTAESDIRPGPVGLWPMYGGNLQNQQVPPLMSDVILNEDNINNISILCTYTSPGGMAFLGYPTIDDNNNSYFSDASGYITSINLDSCELNWRTHIGTLLGYNESITISTYQTLTIFQDSNGNKGLLFGTPTNRVFASNYPDNDGCFAVSVHLNDGTFWWSIELGETNKKQDFYCSTHGFTVDGKYAFGGFAQSNAYNLRNNSKIIGRYFKIDIDKHKIVHIWYPFNYELTNDLDENNTTYNGISAYNFPAIIDDYLIFGTGNLQRVPTKIEECLLNGNNSNFDNYLLLNDSNYIDICGNNQSNNKYWRCLQKYIYPGSLIILNKNTFKLEKGIVLQGCDVWYGPQCKLNATFSPFCPSSNIGYNADLSAVATYKDKNNGKLYVVASQKSNRLHIFEIPNGKLKLSIKYGPYSDGGQFSMAVDEQSLIGIATITGVGTEGIRSRHKLANNITVCHTGSIYAFNLTTGDNIWQIVNPYGYINDSICFDNTSLWSDTVDYTVITNTTCEYGNFSKPFETAKNNVIIPPKYKNNSYLLLEKSRAKFRGPVTVANDMVFVSGTTGDIWIHNLYTGSFIHHFVCPHTQINETQWNRPSVRGGISVVNDRVVLYCGGYYDAANDIVNGNTFLSMKLSENIP